MDRISNLADEILCHIISFLPTKDAVCTSILSTRWRYLFALIPNLEFNCNAKWQTPDAFMNFVDRVVLLRKRESIDRFALYLSKSVDPFRVDGWIRAVLCHSVVELVLSSLNMQIGMPASLFTCKTLVVLKLWTLDSLRVPANVYLPSLKVFHVDSCWFEDDDFGELVSIGCPVLEELVVKSYFNGIECEVNVSSASLKRLSIRAGCATKKIGFAGIVEIIINSPSLVYLQYSGFVDNSIALIRVPSLTEARIDYYKPYRTEAIRTEAIRLLEGIRNIQSLYISRRNIYELLEESVSPPLFHNLTYLEVSVRVMKYFLGLEHLLQYSNFLETLVMKELPCTEKTKYGFELENRRVPRPFLSCLKAIEILSFKGYEAHMQIVKYFLKNAKALENMTIHIREEEKHQLKITKELLMFPRVSRKCQVRIV